MIEEEDVKRIVRGPADLEEQIDKLKKQVSFMQGKCREAGQAILDLELQKESLSKELDRLAEENNNLRIILKGKQNGKE